MSVLPCLRDLVSVDSLPVRQMCPCQYQSKVDLLHSLFFCRLSWAFVGIAVARTSMPVMFSAWQGLYFQHLAQF